MNGPDHYQLAEKLADRAGHYYFGDGADPVVGAGFAAEAQVHATLAVAATLDAAVAVLEAWQQSSAWDGGRI